MSRVHLSRRQDAMAVLTLASSAEQSRLPKGHDTSGGQQGGQGSSGAGGSFGQSGAGGAFPPNFQVPRVHWPIRVPQRPKSQVVPSGRMQLLPAGGAFFGQIARSSEASLVPPSLAGGSDALSSAHAPASVAAAAAVTSTTASRAKEELFHVTEGE